VFTADGECVGTVTDVVETGGGEILQVDNDNREILIPFAQSYIKDIDPEAGKIEVDLPEDLRNLNT
jgi:16S rRNA processing protein RimM